MHRPVLFAIIACLAAGGGLGARAQGRGTCTGVYPSYWQDPAAKFAPMWAGQVVSNAPPSGWRGPVFALSDAFPRQPVDDARAQPWRAPRFDALFQASTPQSVKAELARDYAWAVMDYIQAGNVERDWDVCENPVRGWYQMPFQTYDVMTGREFTHGLTREAPVTFNVKDPDHRGASLTLATTVWAVAYFNPTAAYTLGQVWLPDGSARVPSANVAFREGAVFGKPLFTTATPSQLPMLANMPTWQANISDPSYCGCTSPSGGSCTMVEQSQQCARSTEAWNPVRLLQFDIAVKDHRATAMRWVFGTFVADGVRKAGEADPWRRISPLGLIWGNDPPPPRQLAHDHPADPRRNGFAEAVIFWDTVDMLNEAGGAVVTQHPGHLGCNSRLNGPADNINSSCLSCHMTASVPDSSLDTPPIIAQFANIPYFNPDPSITFQCVTPDRTEPHQGTDASGSAAATKHGISFAAMDHIYFDNAEGGTPVNMTAATPAGPRNVLGDEPLYSDGRADWIPLDFSLQLSISLTEWGQWQQHRSQSISPAARVHSAVPPAR